MKPDERDCNLNNGTIKMNGNKSTANCTKTNGNNKENLQNAPNIDERKNSPIETEIATELSSEMKKKNSKAQKSPMVYKLVLTGGPCSGKTTGQTRLATFFENLGWKVFRVPETATILFGGGIRFADMTKEEADRFQENLLKTMLAIETVFFDLAKSCGKDCLVICDRGAMDAAAYMEKTAFNEILKRNGLNNVDLRDSRYNQVIHLMTAAKGAEAYYQIEGNPVRSEGIEQARALDSLTIESWVGHPYIDVIDNSMENFNMKMAAMIECVCRRIGIDTKDRLAVGATKHKFKVKKLPESNRFPKFQDFDVEHVYLISPNEKVQFRLRKRGQNGKWSYQHTTRRLEGNDQVVEVRRQITSRDYYNYLNQRDRSHHTIFKTRRCFLYQDKYFQMDIYRGPFHPRCQNLILLETYSTKNDDQLMQRGLPDFLEIEKAITGNPQYSMYNLSLKDEWSNANFEKKKVKISKNYNYNYKQEEIHEPNNNELPVKGEMLDDEL